MRKTKAARPSRPYLANPRLHRIALIAFEPGIEGRGNVRDDIADTRHYAAAAGPKAGQRHAIGPGENLLVRKRLAARLQHVHHTAAVLDPNGILRIGLEQFREKFQTVVDIEDRFPDAAGYR